MQINQSASDFYGNLRKYLFHILVLAVLILCTSLLDVAAKVSKFKPNMLFENGTVFVVGSKLTSKANPANVTLLDGEGKTIATPTIESLTQKRFKFRVPMVSSTKTYVLRITGGNVNSDNVEDFPIVIFDAPDLSSPDPSPPDADINVQNVNAKAVVFNNRSLNASNGGNLRWNGKEFIDPSGNMLTDKITMNGISLISNGGGALIWNSHTISTAGGAIEASKLKNSSTGKLTLAGTKSVTIDTDQGGTLSVVGNGAIMSVLRGEYDFAVDGGTTGFKNLRNATLPKNARVIRAWYEVLTTFKSATDATTIGITIPTDDANGVLAPIAINDVSNPWDAGVHGTIQNGLMTTISEKTAAVRNLQLNVAGEALTAGKVVVFAEYMVLP